MGSGGQTSGVNMEMGFFQVLLQLPPFLFVRKAEEMEMVVVHQGTMNKLILRQLNTNRSLGKKRSIRSSSCPRDKNVIVLILPPNLRTKVLKIFDKTIYSTSTLLYNACGTSLVSLNWG